MAHLQLMYQEWVSRLSRKPQNNICIDCGVKDTTHVCINFSTFVCSSCSDLHARELGHQIRSLLGTFSTDEMHLLEIGGNVVAWKVWLSTWTEEDYPVPDSADIAAIKQFMRLKYVEKRWYNEGEDKENALKVLAKKTDGLHVFHVALQNGEQAKQLDLGVTKDFLIFIDPDNVVQSYTYLQVRRWTKIVEGALTFDFGSHALEIMKIITIEADEIGELITAHTEALIKEKYAKPADIDLATIFHKRSSSYKFKLPDETFEVVSKNSTTVAECAEQIAAKIGMPVPEEYSLQKEADKWLKHTLKLGELGCTKDDTLYLKQKFIFYPSISPADPNLNNIYLSCRDNVLSGRNPTSKDEACELGAVQAQLSMGDYDSAKPTAMLVKTCLPQLWQKSKGVDKQLIKEYQKLAGMSAVNAKYGTTIIPVKIADRDVFFGINADKIMFMDGKTKKVNRSFDFTQIRRWSKPAETSILFDFGDQGTTTDSELILQLVYGYIEYCKKKKGKMSAPTLVSPKSLDAPSSPNLNTKVVDLNFSPNTPTSPASPKFTSLSPRSAATASLANALIDLSFDDVVTPSPRAQSSTSPPISPPASSSTSPTNASSFAPPPVLAPPPMAANPLIPPPVASTSLVRSNSSSAPSLPPPPAASTSLVRSNSRGAAFPRASSRPAALILPNQNDQSPLKKSVSDVDDSWFEELRTPVAGSGPQLNLMPQPTPSAVPPTPAALMGEWWNGIAPPTPSYGTSQANGIPLLPPPPMQKGVPIITPLSAPAGGIEFPTPFSSFNPNFNSAPPTPAAPMFTPTTTISPTQPFTQMQLLTPTSNASPPMFFAANTAVPPNMYNTSPHQQFYQQSPKLQI